MVRICAHYLSTSREEDNPDHLEKVFHILVLRSNLISAVQWITNREKGRIFQLGEIFPKTGNTVLGVLHLKQPGTLPLTESIFESKGGKQLAFMPVYIADEMGDSVV